MNKEGKSHNLGFLETYAEYREGIYYCRELPPLVDVSYPCFAIADLVDIVERLSPTTSEEEMFNLQEDFLQIQRKNIDPGFTFISVDSRILNRQVTEKALRISETDPSTGLVNMDRNICVECKGDRFFRLDISRGEKEGLAPRPGANESPEEQIENLVEWATENSFKSIVLVDDVLAYGDTLVPIIQRLKRSVPNISVDVLVGIASSQGKWSGIEKVYEKTGIQTQYLTLIKASPENEWSTGMSIPVSRDWTIFGGKVGTHGETNLHTIYPYFLPFSKPKKAALAGDLARAERSFSLLDFSLKMVKLIDNNRPLKLTIAELIDKKIGVPFTNLACLEDKMVIPNPSMQVLDYINYNRSVLQQNLADILEEIRK